MARREIIWSKNAEEEISQILEFYTIRNKSANYSKKLLTLFSDAIQRISVIPELGLPCENSPTRILIIKEYLVYYQFNEKTLYILNIRDNRQNPITAPFRKS